MQESREYRNPFRGELIFSAISNDAEKEQKTPPVLARLAYTVQVPFSLLRALAAQRRRMAATALIPLGPENVDEDTNELIIQIHRCVGLDRLKSVQGDFISIDIDISTISKIKTDRHCQPLMWTTSFSTSQCT